MPQKEVAGKQGRELCHGQTVVRVPSEGIESPGKELQDVEMVTTIPSLQIKISSPDSNQDTALPR